MASVTGKTVRDHAVHGLAFRSFSSRRDGRPVFVLIHGIGMSHRYLTRLHDELARDAEVHTIDLPGFGGLPKPRRAADIADVARALGHVLDALRVRSAVLVGHSMGAQWVVELGVQRPDLAGAVVTIGPVTDDRRRGALTQALLLARDSALEPPRPNAIVFSDYLRCGPVWYARQAVHMLRYPTEDRVAGLTVPLLVVRGSDDPIASQSWAQRLAARAPAATVAVIAGHRHLAQFTAAPAVAARIRSLVSG
ncbi:Lysophospholipase, alpha-beta hydrolase superfamily [Microbacterium testaceum StLB037]|uniref:Lysophospholipase, alpha-beta hydrolase superfamily n=1 Tax=Microbacterium testaceum (strain StLB037) TaxID=979556 RepID=A0A1H0QTT8_MICTS|nr:Lysophospholipase, alpha-beta hydrolase superfamily [Microbacterium testaceum StLB037]